MTARPRTALDTRPPPFRRRAAWSVVLALVAATVLAPVSTAGAGPGVTVTRDIVYGQGEVGGGGSFADLELDLYTPVGGGTDLPLVVMIHGGGFTAGDKAGMATFARAAAERGHVVAAINYRLQGDDPVPSARMDPVLEFLGGDAADPQEVAAVAAFDDTLTALDFLLARPEVDPDRITLWGSSAGAITSVYVAYALDEFGIAAPPVAAVVDNWGGFIATPGDANALETGDPPIWINHGTGDTTVPYSLAEDIVRRSQDLGQHYVLHTEITGHGFSLTATPFAPGVSVLTAVLDWLDEVVIAERGCADPFYDLPAWLEVSGDWAYCGPYLAGYPDHTFRDGRPITRAEAARLLYRVAGSPSVALLPPHGLSDVPPWIEDAVRWLVADDYAVGYPDGTFRPNRDISRGELTRMQHRIAGEPVVSTPHVFPDVPPWLTAAVDWVADPANDPRYAVGYPDGTYGPDRDITRGETARMTCRIEGTTVC